MPKVLLKNDELEIEICDNEAHGQHLKGYNGISKLVSTHYPETLFVPSVAGLNYEFIFDGSVQDRSVLMEPRNAPMTLRSIDENSALLHQPATPHWGVESWTEFSLKNPNAVDFNFRCIPRKKTFKHGYMGLFWASYINGPENKAIYFSGTDPTGNSDQWYQFLTHAHDHESTVCSVDEKLEIPHDPQAAQKGYLYLSFSSLRYRLPMFYGRFGPMVFMLMFENTRGLRFTHSPSGGGSTSTGDDTNPAWDYQYIVENPKVDQEYSFRARMVYKPYVGREDLLMEYNNYFEYLKKA